MTKADIVNEISKSTGVDKAAVLETVEKFMEVVKDSLANGENVYLRGFGSFIIKTRSQKTARNISKNTTIIILFSKNRHSGCDFAEQRDLLHRLRFFEKNIRRYMQSLCYFQDVSVFRLIIAGEIFTDG